MRQSEFKMKYDPETGKFTRQHICGKGITDVFKNTSVNYIQLFLFTKRLKSRLVKTCLEKQ